MEHPAGCFEKDRAEPAIGRLRPRWTVASRHAKAKPLRVAELRDGAERDALHRSSDS